MGDCTPTSAGAILRQQAFPVGSDVNTQQRLMRELTPAQPLPADVLVTTAALGAVPTAEITIDGVEPRYVVLYFHGGVYALGDAFTAADLASQIGRRTHAKVISADYRLAPSTHIRQQSTPPPGCVWLAGMNASTLRHEPQNRQATDIRSNEQRES